MMCAMLTSCNDDFKEVPTPTGSSIAVVVSEDSDLDIFEAAITKTGLKPSLSNNNAGIFTVFAPSDDAFVTYFKTALGKGDPYTEADVLAFINNEMSSSTPVTTAALSARLTYHIVSSSIPSTLLTGDQVFSTLNSSRLSISKSTDVLLNASAKVVEFDHAASNGFVHIIDKVLSAPSGSALATIGASAVYTVTPPAGVPAAPSFGDANGTNYNIFAYALSRTGLIFKVQPNVTIAPEYTYLLPTDDVMRAAFGDGSAASAAAENAVMATINSYHGADSIAFRNRIAYHILAGRVLTSDMSDGEQLTTLQGGKITVSGTGPIYLQDLDGDSDSFATISSANNLTNAGAIHRINYFMEVE